MALENIYLDVIVAAAIGGGGIYLKSIKNSVNKVSKQMGELYQKVGVLDETVKTHTDTVYAIKLCESIMAQIDLKVAYSMAYLSDDDVVMQGFVKKMGDSAKSAIEWAIHTKLNVTEKEVRGVYELINIEVRDFLLETPPEFALVARDKLKKISQHHIESVIKIVKSKYTNGKMNDFFILTGQTVDEVINTIITARIENKLKDKEDEKN